MQSADAARADLESIDQSELFKAVYASSGTLKLRERHICWLRNGFVETVHPNGLLPEPMALLDRRGEGDSRIGTMASILPVSTCSNPIHIDTHRESSPTFSTMQWPLLRLGIRWCRRQSNVPDCPSRFPAWKKCQNRFGTANLISGRIRFNVNQGPRWRSLEKCGRGRLGMSMGADGGETKELKN